MTKKERAVACVELLKAEFPDDLCSLTYEDPYQLLVAVRLSVHRRAGEHGHAGAV